MLPFNSKNIHLRPVAIYEPTSIRVISSEWPSTSPASEPSGEKKKLYLQDWIYLFIYFGSDGVPHILFSFILNHNQQLSPLQRGACFGNLMAFLTQGGRGEEGMMR